MVARSEWLSLDFARAGIDAVPTSPYCVKVLGADPRDNTFFVTAIGNSLRVARCTDAGVRIEEYNVPDIRGFLRATLNRL